MAKRGGRTKGTPNKTSKETKENILMAFHALGGVGALTEWAQCNKTEFYKLWAKTLPTTLASDEKNPLIPKEIRIKLV